MELLEVSNHGWDSETCEYHRSSLEYLAQFLIQGPSEGTGAEFSEDYNKGFESTSESQQSWAKYINLAMLIQYVRDHLDIDTNNLIRLQH